MNPPRAHRVRRVVFVMPSLFTLANLFFGIWSMVLAWHGEFYRAAWFIVVAGLLDMLDGMVARVGKAGTRFGAELDSLVDIVSFGVAPASLTYLWFFATEGQYAWVFSYAFVVCVALRLARYNVQLTADHKSTFSGLPSPAAGMTLATYYPFTRTAFYQTELAHLPWSQLMVFLTIALSLAMVSNIRYARLPRIGFRSVRGVLGLVVNLTILGFAVFARDLFFFPLGIAYLTYGLARAAVLGFLEKNEDLEPQRPEGGGVVLHHMDSGNRLRRREPGARDG